jgi:hypothetical protein
MEKTWMMTFPMYGKKHVPNHQPVIIIIGIDPSPSFHNVTLIPQWYSHGMFTPIFSDITSPLWMPNMPMVK